MPPSMPPSRMPARLDDAGAAQSGPAGVSGVAKAGRLSAERALARLRQLAREEAAAVEAGDVEGLCRAVALLPSAMEDYADCRPGIDPDARNTILEILRAHDQAREFLETRLDALSTRLSRLSAARRLRRAATGATQPGSGVLDRTG